MILAELLHLHNHTWHEDVKIALQDGSGEVWGFSELTPAAFYYCEILCQWCLIEGYEVWMPEGRTEKFYGPLTGIELAEDHKTTLLTREAFDEQLNISAALRAFEGLEGL